MKQVTTREQQLEVGDVVRLKTGGPKMTVSMILRASTPLRSPFSMEIVDGTPTIGCQWFTALGDGTYGPLQTGAFASDALDVIKPK